MYLLRNDDILYGLDNKNREREMPADMMKWKGAKW